MTTATFPSADTRAHRRTVRAMGVSTVLHVALLLWLVLRPPGVDVGEVLTHIEYYDVMPVPAAAPPAAQVPVASDARSGTQRTVEHFERSQPTADRAPEPQSDFAVADRIASRLDALVSRDRPTAVVSAADAPGTSRLLASGHTSDVPATGQALDLTRGRTASTPLALDRGAPVAPARLDAAVAQTAVPRTKGAKPADAPTATRTLAGAQIAGPVADRPILSHVTPEYPEWAKRDAVEGSVTIRFIVRPDGSIKENVFVQKTAGFEDFDQNAIAAIRVWRFVPLNGGRVGEQWGTITFHYRLRDSG
jgi:TonB family protein